MKTLTLPNTDLRVSQFCFGCWGIVSDFHWGDRDEAEAEATIHAAIDAGVSFFDTAEMYGEGASEALLGRLFSGKRDRLVIATKVRPDSMRPEQIKEGCERSLKRLNTDYIDLYQTHWTDRTIPIEDSWAAMLELKAAGKVREIGLCNAGLRDLEAVCQLRAPVANQLPLNLLWRAVEHEILPRCISAGIGVLAYSPLMHGLLADKYQTAADVPDGRARSRHFSTDRQKARHGEPGCEQATFQTISAVREISHSLARPMADVALAWVAQQAGVCAVIVGVRTIQQLQENLATLESPLPPQAIAELNRNTDKLSAILGPNPDMWQGPEHSRFR